ncbi:MAG TPA: hypothetical protein VLG76_08495 [Rhabdochlamydiaceae bacterium]|nr:hypothetical protein [Rhabdochlamydiaceae bacterium]
MLNFFRKYQKIFFVVITFIIVISFTFFGTFSTFASRQERPDQKIGVALDGSAITSREIELMNRFLKNGIREGGKTINLLNGSVVHHDFLENGLATLLVERYWADIKGDLESRFRKAKHFTPYVHPQVPFLSAKVIWEQYCPEMNPLLEELKAASDEITPDTFSLLLKLYLAQSQLPSPLLRQLLHRQQDQYSWIRPDPMLDREDLSLFGFGSVEEWFGPKFMNLVSQFLINASAYAKQKGYQLTKEEARADLLLNVRKGLELYSQGKPVSLEDAGGYYYQTLQALGIDESKAIVIWKRVMGFRRLFQEGAGGVFLDSLSLKQFHSFTRDSAKIALYQLPQALRFSDFSSLMKFQCYLETISAEKCTDLNLPKTFLSLSAIEKKFPELVQKKFQVKLAQVKVDQLLQRISLKETWEWELDENHFAYLKEEFPLLALESSSSRDDRFFALEKLDPKLRLKVDGVARKNIFNLHPEWVDEALDKAPFTEEMVAIKKGSLSLPIDGMTDALEFGLLLEKEDPSLRHFTANDETFYRIEVLKKPEEKEVLTFAEALKDGTLDRLLDQKLEAAYPDVRKKSPSEFLVEKNNWKPFDQVKDQIGMIVYPSLFHSFKQKSQFQEFMKKAKSDFEQGGQREFIGHPLAKQWDLVKSEIDMRRKKEMDPLLDEAFRLKEGEWSSLAFQQDGDICFFQLLERKQDKESSLEDITEAQRPLVIDAQRNLMNQILDLLQERKLISLSSLQYETE